MGSEGDIRLANCGVLPTSVNPRGSAVVDLTWITPDLVGRMLDWKVDVDGESLSDHNYIRFRVVREVPVLAGNSGSTTAKYPRWNYGLLDPEILAETLEWSCIDDRYLEQESWNSASSSSLWIDRTLTNACDMAAPRAGKVKRRESAHWWSAEIAELRRKCVRAKRQLTRFNSRYSRIADTNDGLLTDRRLVLRRLYKDARRTLRKAIQDAKLLSWRELLASIDADPWGRPYLLVLGRLRRSRPGLTETLEEGELQPLLDSLFPLGIGGDTLGERSAVIWAEEWDVSPAEVLVAIWKKRYSNTAPGLDGVRSVIWRKSPRSMMIRLSKCLTKCLREGIFPAPWKKAGLVLIPKAGSNFTVRPIKARPICLLSVTGKVFERVIVERLLKWMEQHPRAGLSDNQFGFRQGRSTYDALFRVKNLIDSAMTRKEYVTAVGIDISNAFNSIPFSRILAALRTKGFPVYLINIIQDYFCDRTVEYFIADGSIICRKVCAGVPQGSVLGPLLWNIVYDEVLKIYLFPGCHVLGYADDTLVLASARSIDRLIVKVNMQTAAVVHRIQGLGLKVAADKTEAALFYCRGRRPVIFPEIRVGDSYIQTGGVLKYLGIILDSRLNFGEHFKYVAAKASKVASALGRLMPNLRGPSEVKRILYANTIMSVITYGAPVWWEAMLPVTASARRRQAPLLKVQRFAALRVVSAYRTVSLEASLLLARMPPLYLLVGYYHRTYTRIRELRNSIDWDPREEDDIRKNEKSLLYRQWKIHIGRGNQLSGIRVRAAIVPCFDAWIGHSRKWGIGFHLTQILTGHGCFADYLFRIGRENTDICFHCGMERDTAQHTLEICNAWVCERVDLRDVVGQNLTLTNLVTAMLESEDKWNAVVLYANSVMLQKEDAERARREAALAVSSVSEDGDETSDSLFGVPVASST